MYMANDNSKGLSYKYEAFGLTIHSEIELPELIHSNSEKVDIKIYLGIVEYDKKDILIEGMSYIVKKEAIYRFWDSIGKFRIDKDSIIVNPVQNLPQKILRNFILGSVFATLLRMRKFFVLHASSVNINGSAIAFSGFKGYGKSTTVMAFYLEGYPIVADDYIPICFDNLGIPLITPGFPSLRLSNESRKAMGIDNIDLESDIIDKTYISLKNFFSKLKLPLKKIYILKRGKKAKIIDLKPQEAFIELVKNTFGIYMFSKSELPDNFFQIEKILKKTEVSILEVPDSLKDIQKIVKLVEDDIGDKL